MEIESKNNFIHGAIVFLSTLVIVVLALILLVFLFTTPATRQEANVQKQLEKQISQYPKSYQLKQLISLEEGRVSRFLVDLYGRCVEGVSKLSQAIKSLNNTLDSLLAATQTKSKSNDF